MFGCNFSLLNYDAIGGGIFGSMRLGFNQAMMHANVYPSLFTYPTMNFGSFTPYQQFTNSNWLLDPGFALQSTFSNMQNYGYFGAGMMQPIQQTAWPWAGASVKTAEEKAQEKEYKELKAVASEVIKKLEGDAKTTLQAAIDATEGTVQERINSLKTELTKEAAKNAAKELLLNPTDDIKVGTKKLSTILKDFGLGNKPTQTKIDDMNNYCNQQGEITQTQVSGLNISKENVLLYMNELNDLNKLDDDNKQKLKDELVENLMTLAEDLINSGELDDKLKTNLSACRTRFIGSKADTASFDDFKNLYACCLLGASQRADKQVNDGTSYDDIVGNSVYTDKAKEILKNKNFSEDNINNALTGTVDVSEVPYNPTESRHYVPMTFDNQDLQTAHNAAAAVIAEIADADFDSLDVSNVGSDNNEIVVKLNNCKSVKFKITDGSISKISVNYQNGGSTNGYDIVYFLGSDSSTYYVSNNWDSEENQFRHGVKLQNGNDFAKLQTACATLVERARTKLAE